MIKSLPQKEKGFTLIEMIVSLGVFSIVITIAVGALLVIISTNKQLQTEQSVMSNLAFAMDSMTREMRTGYSYVCASVPNITNPVTIPGVGNVGQIFKFGNNAIDDDHDTMDDKVSSGDATMDCSTASSQKFRGVSIIESGDSITGLLYKRIMYYYDEDAKTVMRRVGNDNAYSIVPSELLITNAKFYVTGSESLDNSGTDVEQPTVTIYLEAQEISNPSKTYSLQTTVTQRILDI